MAYFYRRSFRYPRRNYYRRRYYRRRTHGPRRRTYRRRVRRTGRWRRYYRKYSRRHAAKIVQWNPAIKTKCKIIGLTPLMMALGADSGVQDFILPTTSAVVLWKGGGVDSGTLSLLDLYWEERFWRARWSKSNQGYNLCRYFGVTLTLYRLQHHTYIFWWTVEDFTDDQEPLTVCHPSQLLLTNNHVLVKHYGSNRQVDKAVKIKIPPPTYLDSSWHTFKDIAKKPLLKWRTSLIDTENPWTGFPDNRVGLRIYLWSWDKTSKQGKQTEVMYYPLLDEGNETQVCIHKADWNDAGTGPKLDSAQFWPGHDDQWETLVVPFYMYTFGRSAEWYDTDRHRHMPRPEPAGGQGFFLYIKHNSNPAWRDGITGQLITAWDVAFMTYNTAQRIAASGPWVEKGIQAPGINVTMRYSFRFQWGGRPGTKLPPAAPDTGGPHWPKATYRWPGSFRADIRDPTQINHEVLQGEDYDSSGIITERAFRRVAKPHYISTDEKDWIWGRLRYPPPSKRKRQRPSSEERETDGSKDDYTQASETETETETENELGHRRKRNKLRILLDRLGIRQHLLTSPSGKWESNSI
nr:ORF1 [Rodent Torque teno virus 2]AHN14855.1 ORF1 [Rodent Torque teno virus 2]